MSGETIPYHLRPNKFVERSLFVDILSHIDRYLSVSEYLYVSFAGPYLEDFKVIHAAFGNRKMLSLEQTDWVYQRQRFNIPYGCIDCCNKNSQRFITDYTDIVRSYGNPSVLIWLDYMAADQTREQLTEYEGLLSKLKAHDVLKVTLNANPASLGSVAGWEADELRSWRLEVLNERIGDYLPNNTTPEEMKHSSYPSLLLQAVRKAASNAMEGARHLVFHPIASYVYEDSHQMLTVAGIVLTTREVQHFLQHTGLESYEFATNNWQDIIVINVPHLSAREKLYLDTLIYKQTRLNDHSRLKGSTKLKVTLAPTAVENVEMAERYMRFYRHYPHYHRIHY